MWQAVAAVAALVTALAGGSVGVAGFIRSSRSEEAREKAASVEREVSRQVDAQKLGLEYMQRAVEMLQQTNLRQQGEIGELRGELKDCREERKILQQEMDDLRGRFET